MTAWSVLLAEPAGVEAGALGRFFESVKKVPRIDAQRLARRCWGVLGNGLSEQEAGALVRSAESAGIRTVSVEDGSVADLGLPVLVHGVRFEDQRVVFLVGVPPSPRPVALEEIRLLSVASLRKDTNVTKIHKEDPSLGRKIAGVGVLLTTGLPIGFGKAKETQRTQTETEWILFLDIFGDAGRWRVVPSQFDFSGLGAEKTTAGADNLRRLFARFQRSAPKALVNRGARCWQEGRPINTAGYDEPADVDQESRWLLTLASR